MIAKNLALLIVFFSGGVGGWEGIKVSVSP